MVLCVFEDDGVKHFLPLVHTRAVYDLRLGIRNQLEALREAFGSPQVLLHARRQVAGVTAEENDLLVNRVPEGLDVLFVNGRWIPEDGDAFERIRRAADDPGGRMFTAGETVVAAWVPGATSSVVSGDAVTAESFEGLPEERLDDVRLIGRLWDLQHELDGALRRDYDARTKGLYVYERPGVTVADGALLAAGERVFLGPGTRVRPGAVLNAESGPIYVGQDVVIKELAVIKGPAFIGSGSEIESGADIEGCSFGPTCKVGGQVESTIIHSYSNKAHSGFLGNAYVGRWCNFGADTNNSNLKNDYGEVKMYDAVEEDFVASGRQFLGLVFGDHSKSGIDTMFNTGTVAGVACNIYGAGYQPRLIPSFSWGGPDDFAEYRIDKALAVAETVMNRRDRQLTDAQRDNLRAVFEATRGEQVRK